MRRRRSTTRKRVARILGSLNHWRAPRPFSLLKSTSLYWRQRLIIYSIFSPLFHLTTQVSGSPSGRCGRFAGSRPDHCRRAIAGAEADHGQQLSSKGLSTPNHAAGLVNHRPHFSRTTSPEPLSHQPSPAFTTIYTTLSAYVPL